MANHLPDIAMAGLGSRSFTNPAYVTPKSPAHATHQNPAYVTPKNPAYATHQNPAYVSPQNPVYVATNSPAYITPQSPAYVTSNSPAYITPQSPAYITPQNPVHVTPQNPAHVTSQNPAHVTFTSGPKCLRCYDSCPGLDLHYFRKICKNCRCLAEDHDIPSCQQRDCRPMSMLFQTYESPPAPPDPKPDWMTKFEKMSIMDQEDLSKLNVPQNDVVMARLISENLRSQKFISQLPEDKREFASKLRRKQLQRQLPLHDLDPRFCNSLAPSELSKYDKFADRRRKKAAGIGQVGEVTSSGSVVGCQSCQQKMEMGAPAIIAAKVPGECWHPGCFVCYTCRQLLVDMIYFNKKGRIYCERHYADMLYPRCFACDEIIFSREYTHAESRSWHVHHFCCWHCDAALAGQRYIAKDNNPYCVNCFDKLFSKICSTCQRPITTDAPGVTHMDLHWHACPHCFSCHSCGRNLLNQQFMLKEGRLFCGVNCRHRSGPTCLTAAIARQFTNH